jgi:hypothetical protein
MMTKEFEERARQQKVRRLSVTKLTAGDCFYSKFGLSLRWRFFPDKHQSGRTLVTTKKKSSLIR